MNHSFKKYQAKPEGEQQLHLRKSNKKLLQNFLLNGDGDKDDVIIRKIINATQEVPFTEAHVEKIKNLYNKISKLKRDKFKLENNFSTTLLKKKNGEGMEERVPTKDDDVAPLPTHTIEMRKEAYAAYKGAKLYLDENKEKALKLLKTANILWIITVNGVRSSEAIKAFELLEACGPLYTDLFFRDHPEEAGYLTANLPVEFRQQRKTAFQRGFTRYNYEEQDKKTIEAGKKDPNKYVAPKVTRDNKVELFKMIKQALDKEEKMTHVQEQDIKTDNPTDPNSIAPHQSSGIELFLAIAVEAGLEDKELQDMLNSAAIPSNRRNQLKAKYPTAFDLKLLDKENKSLVQGKDRVTHGNRNASTAGLLANIAGTVGSGAVGITIGKHRLKNIKLLRVQGSMAGTLGGLKLANDKNDEYKPEDYKKWLESKAGKLLNPKTSKADKRDLKHAGKLGANKVNLSFDLLKKRKGEKGKGQKNRIKAFINALPFDGLNYISGDKSIVSDEGVIKYLFAHISWDATRGKDQKKNELAQVKIFLKEVLFNNFRAVMFKDSYNMGKLHITDIEIDLTQVIQKSGFRQTVLTGLYDFLMNPTMLTTAMLFHVIARFQGQAAMVDTKKALLEELKKMPMDFTSLTIKLGGVNLENFYGSTMGGIGKIGLTNTSLQVSAQQKPDEKDNDKFASPIEKKKIAKQAELEGVKAKRNRLRNELIKLDRQISAMNTPHSIDYKQGEHSNYKHGAYQGNIHQLRDKKRDLLNQLERQQFPEKIQALEKQIKELETNGLDKHNAGLKYAIRLNTDDKVQMKDAQLLQEMMRNMLLSGMKENGLTLEGLEGLTDIELPQGLSLDLLMSANDIKNMGLEVKQVKIPNTLKASRFQYNKQITDEKGKVKKDSKGNDLVSLQVIGTGVSIEGISLGVRVNFKDIEVKEKAGKDEGLLDNVTISKLKADSFKFDKLWLKMPEPTTEANKDDKKAPPPQKMHNVAVFNTASEVKNVEVDFDMKKEALNLNFKQLISQNPDVDENIQIDSEFASKKGKSNAFNEKTQLLLQKVEKFQFEMTPEGTMTARVGNVTIPQVVLQKFSFKNDTIAIGHDQDDDRKVKTAIAKVELQNLEFVLDKKGYYIKQLDKLSIGEVLLSGKVTYKGKVIPLNNGLIKGIEASNLRISIEKGKRLLQMVQEGSASIEKLNLPKIVYGTVGHLDLFDIEKIKIDRVTQKGKEGIDYSIGSIKAKGGGKASGKNLSGGLSTGIGGKYTESKDGKTKKLTTHLNNTQLNAEVKNKAGKKEAAAGISTKKISFETDLNTYATVSLGTALNLDHIFYEAEDGLYIKNLPGGKPLQLLNPQAKVTFVKKKVKNDKGVEEEKIVAYDLQYFSIGKLVARNLEAGDKKMGLKLLVPSNKEASLNEIVLSGTFRTKDNKMAMKATTKGLDIQEIKTNFKDQILASPYLKASTLTFSRGFAGNMDATIEGLDMGLLTESRNSAKVKTEETPNGHTISVKNASTDPMAPIFRSGKIKLIKRGKTTDVIISDPKLGEISINGRIKSAAGKSYEGNLFLNKLLLSGSLEGDLIIKDTPNALTVSSVNDMIIRVSEADLSIASFYGLLLFGEKIDKTQDKSKQQSKPEHRPYDKLMFLNDFAGSKLTIKAFGDTIALDVTQKADSNKEKRAAINPFQFIRELTGTALKYAIAKYNLGIIDGDLEELTSDITKIAIKLFKYHFEGDIGYSILSGEDNVSLYYFVDFLTNLSTQKMLPYINNVVEEALPLVIDLIQDYVLAGSLVIPTIGPIVGGGLSIGLELFTEKVEKYVKGKIAEKLNSSSGDEPVTKFDDIVPKAAQDLIKDLNLELQLNLNAYAGPNEKRYRGLLQEMTKSELTGGGYSLGSSIHVNFKGGSPTLTLKNTVFNGFSLPIKTTGSNGVLSTNSMGMGKMEAKLDGLNNSDGVTLKAQDIYLQGFKLNLKKTPTTTNNTKKKKGN